MQISMKAELNLTCLKKLTLKEIVKTALMGLVAIPASTLFWYGFYYIEVTGNGPEVYEIGNKNVVVRDDEIRANLMGIDVDRDGALDYCSYSIGFMGDGGTFNFKSDLSDLPEPLSKKYFGKVVGRLQYDYDIWEENKTRRFFPKM